MKFNLVIEPSAVKQIREWIENRGGVAVWKCVDLGSPRIGSETLTPATHKDGTPATSPHWSNGDSPDRIVTDLSQVGVRSWREVSRIKVRNGPPCFGNIHRADRAKLDAAMAKAGDGATWQADYSSQSYGSPWFTAVISVPSETIPIS